MSTGLPANISERLKEPFGKIFSIENFGGVVNGIAELIYQGELDPDNIQRLLREHNIKQLENVKANILDLILAYIELVLQDNYVTVTEAENMKFLKRILKVKEGDFYRHKYYEVERLLDKQFERMYRDNNIDTDEALQKVELQELFDLSYDQFLELSNKAVQSALVRGANPSDLDTFIKGLIVKR